MLHAADSASELRGPEVGVERAPNGAIEQVRKRAVRGYHQHLVTVAVVHKNEGGRRRRRIDVDRSVLLCREGGLVGGVGS